MFKPILVKHMIYFVIQKEKEQLLHNSTVSSLSKLKLGFDFDDRSRQGFRYRILNTGIVLQRYI